VTFYAAATQISWQENCYDFTHRNGRNHTPPFGGVSASQTTKQQREQQLQRIGRQDGKHSQAG
jgi:hypothetical protein